MGNGWTPERRAKQAAMIRRWKPWEKSTGPRSAEGKSASARNAWAGGYRALFRELRQQIREQEKARRTLTD